MASRINQQEECFKKSEHKPDRILLELTCSKTDIKIPHLFLHANDMGIFTVDT